MSTHIPGFQSFFRFLHHFVLVKFCTSSIRVINYMCSETSRCERFLGPSFFNAYEMRTPYVNTLVKRCSDLSALYCASILPYSTTKPFH